MSTKRKLKEQAQAEASAHKSDQKDSLLKWAYILVCLLLLSAVFISAKSANVLMKNMRSSKNVKTNLESYTPWPQEVRDEFQQMLVQNGGRVKPINTFSRFNLMQINNGTKVKFETKDGKKHSIKADEWLLDALFRGDIAKELPIFNVDDTAAISELGVPPKIGDSEHRKRDRYSYNHLMVARKKMFEEGQRIADKKKKYDDSDEDPALQPNRTEVQLLRLSRNINLFESNLGQFGVIHRGEQIINDEILPKDLQQFAKRMEMTEFLRIMPEMGARQLFAIMQNPGDTDEARLLQTPFKLFFYYANTCRSLFAFPPKDRMQGEWQDISTMLLTAMADKSERDRTIKHLDAISELYKGQKAMFVGLDSLSGDSESSRAAIVKPMVEVMAAFVKSQKDEAQARYDTRLADFDQQIEDNTEPLEDKRLAEQRAELKKEGFSSEKEVKLYNTGRFHSAIGWYGIGFLVVAFSWFFSGSKLIKWIAIAATVCLLLGLYHNVMGIVERCVIRSRPPITNLYDTVIFITATTVILALLLEYFTRRGVGLIVAAVGGMAGMFLSFRHETNEATDTMDPLQAVLDTNFWLATHVTTINIGYSAGLLAMLLGGYYLLHRFLRPLPKVVSSLISSKPMPEGGIFKEDKETRDFFKSISTMTYGIICFCLLFSIVGTVLGGVWANYSWGRFWGWDPKENGALMICLWALVILHAKMGGYIRNIGMAVNAIFLGMIVTFSWWGVNNLGIGLHSYGFTEGVWKALFISWIVSLLIMACGIPLWMHERFKNNAKKSGQSSKKSGASNSADEVDLAEGGAPA